MMNRQWILLFVVAVFLCGCTSTYKVISNAALESELKMVEVEMRSYGYYPVGKNTDTRNELTVIGQSYFDNDYITSNTYSFSDTVGNTMKYTISYRLWQQDSFIYVSNVEVKGCETSNINEYNKLCGKDSPKRRIEMLVSDSEVELYDASKTYALTGGICIVVAFWIWILTL